MDKPHIHKAIIVQVILFVGFHVFLYLDDTKLTNALYLGNISEYVEEVLPATLWNVAFSRNFPGQIWFFVLLPVVGVVFLLRARDHRRRKISVAVFHICFVTWIIFPLLATKLGVYRGP